MKAATKIRNEIDLYERLKPSDQPSRWRYGYIDGLRTALKWVEEENAKPKRSQEKASAEEEG